MHQRFGIAVGDETMAARNQVLPQFLVIVDLAVEYHPNGAVLVRDRLVAGAQIDDAEAAHADAARPVYMKAFIVGAAMANAVAHRTNLRDADVRPRQQLSCDTAHTV